MISKKLIHAWGLEELLVDATAERDYVRQFL